ncbi:hypothetical protein QO010_002801 [Caulobacter ginsengisoli]|uniref:Uncharacterized protein n=1 Tax=Caulobacter ginsengisoli TaxID=400775 RepID=A0ABU0IVQ3_9CAUL|nr:hypothetical protein [Caulobacter ginsengisoli]MDQ0465017.1 hypothetical protein [Caulobacter ginsengisoli]
MNPVSTARIVGLTYLIIILAAPFSEFAVRDSRPGLVAEVGLALWLLVRAVNPDRWRARAAASSLASPQPVLTDSPS